MSLLRVFQENDAAESRNFQTFEEIVKQLNRVDIRFERWNADRNLAKDATQEEILSAYVSSLSILKQERGFATADVISVHTEMPNHAELRQKFINEHTHNEDEARFFVDGCGIFYIHTSRSVYAILCERGDFLNVPAGTRHWFDMGPQPHLKVIRTFNTPEGWVADFTGSDIASRFPRFEEFSPVPA